MKNPTQPLNKYLQPLGSPIDTPPVNKQVPWEFGIKQGIQVKKIIASHESVKKFQQQITGGFASGTFADGGTLFLTSTLSPVTPHINDPMFAIPYAGIFLGTAPTTNGQLYPNLGTANGTMFPLQAGLDFYQFNGTAPVWNGWVINHSGAAATIGINIIWQFIWFNSGTAKFT